MQKMNFWSTASDFSRFTFMRYFNDIILLHKTCDYIQGSDCEDLCVNSR